MSGFLPEDLNKLSLSINSPAAATLKDSLASSLKTSATMSVVNDAIGLSVVKSLDFLPSIKTLLGDMESSYVKAALEIRRSNTARLAELTCIVDTELQRILRSAMPYMSESNRVECEEVVLPQLGEQGPKKLSFEIILAIISLLLTALSTVITLIPDNRLDKIIEQNDLIIEQNEQIIRFQADQIRHSDADGIERLAYDIADTIRYLSDEVNALTEQSDGLAELRDDANDCVVPQSQNRNDDNEE